MPVKVASAALLSLLSFFTPSTSGFLYSNVIDVNFPDPSLIQLPRSSVNYAFATRNNVTNCPTAVTDDFDSRTWTVLDSDCMPKLGSWVVRGGPTVQNLWAPDVTYIPHMNATKWAIYYSAVSKESGLHCVSIARSAKVEGPYVDTESEPLVCPPVSWGGAIDASAFVDRDGKRYMIYKGDGGAATPVNHSTPLILHQTSRDGATLYGGGVTLFNNAGKSDDYVVEAPVLVNPGYGVHFLFFSSGNTFSTTYTISYATSVNGIFGPYGERQLLMKGQGAEYCGQTFVSPGGADISMDGGRMVFHQGFGGLQNVRTMNSATISFKGRRVSLNC